MGSFDSGIDPHRMACAFRLDRHRGQDERQKKAPDFSGAFFLQACQIIDCRQCP